MLDKSRRVRTFFDVPGWTVVVTLALALLLTLGSCSTQDVINVALSKDPEKAVQSMARARAESYKRDPRRLVEDAKRAKRQFDKLVAFLKGEVADTWGEDEVVIPSKKRYVKYTQAYKSRAIVDFDTGRITVETLAEDEPRQNLEQAIITTLLTPDDPRSVDLYSDKQIKLSGRPYLDGLVLDHRGRPATNVSTAESYAAYLVTNEMQARVTRQNSSVRFVTMQMVVDRVNQQAKRYLPIVNQHAKRFGVSKSLVFAVIKIESAFNPFAVSSAPAYGLMQLVPTSGGRDAYRLVKGKDGIPSKDYLFDSNNNIELGTAYLHLVDDQYLNDVRQPISREYCVIAAYNGGTGNVLRTFSKDRQNAINVINELSPADVYRQLRTGHPRDETRRYLSKVIDARKEFIKL